MRLRRLVFVLALFAQIPTAPAQTATRTSLAIAASGSAVATVKQGTVVTLVATVSMTSGGAVAPPGQVKFCEVGVQPTCTDIRLLATVPLSSAGTASYKFFPGAGTHTYQAMFLGTHIEAASSSTSTALVVTPFYPTATSLAATSQPAGYTLTATVTGTGGTVPPTGTVTFEDASNGNYVLGSAPLVGAAASAGFIFPMQQLIYTQEICLSAAVADVNGDGKPDLILGLEGLDDFGVFDVDTIEVLLGNGDGTFTATPPIPLKLGVINIGVADLNGDGKLDLVAFEVTANVANLSNPNLVPPSTIQVLLGNGDGTFSVGQAIPNPNSNQAYPPLYDNPVYPPFANHPLAIGDFNGDGIPDLAVATAAYGTVAVYFGKGDGTFRPGPVTNAGLDPDGLAVGDFNGDGFLDLAITEPITSGNTVGRTTSVFILLGKGDGTFTAAPAIQGVDINSAAIVTGDFNDDGFLDLAVESRTTTTVPGNVSVYLGKGDGTFAQAMQSPILGTASEGSVLAIGDFNGDGKADLVTSGGPRTLSLLLGNGDGTFQQGSSLLAAGSAVYGISDVALGDFTGGGLSDIASADFAQDQAFTILSQLTPQTSTATLAGVSIVGDGLHDIVAIYSGDSNYQPSTSPPVLLVAEPQPAIITLTVNPTTTMYGQPVAMTATLTPITAQNHSASGIITFGVGGNTTLGTSTMVNGVAMGTTTLLPVGTDAVTATYSNDPYFTSSGGSAIEVVTGYPSLSVLTPTPNPSYVGQLVAITASVTGVGSTIVPTGPVTFYDNATIIGHGTLDATGHASMTTSTLALGVHTLSFVYPGDLGFYPSTSAPVTQVVTLEGSTTTLTAAPNPAGTGQPVTLTAAVTLSGPGTPAGTIAFYDGPAQLNQTTLDPTGHATYTTSALALGTHSLTAVYLGTAAYGGSTSPVVLEIIETPGFIMTLTSPSITLQTYQHTTTTVTLTSLGDFADSIALACGSAPTYVTCIFTPSPAPLIGNGTATVSFYLDTDSILGGSGINGPIHGSLAPPPTSTRLALLLSPFTVLTLLAARRRNRRTPHLLLVLAILTLPATLFLTSCAANVIIPIPSATPGTYTIPITAAAASGLTHTTNLTLTVTP